MTCQTPSPLESLKRQTAEYGCGLHADVRPMCNCTVCVGRRVAAQLAWKEISRLSDQVLRSKALGRLRGDR